MDKKPPTLCWQETYTRTGKHFLRTVLDKDGREFVADLHWAWNYYVTLTGEGGETETLNVPGDRHTISWRKATLAADKVLQEAGYTVLVEDPTDGLAPSDSLWRS